MVGSLVVVVSPFRPTSRKEGRGPHHHVEAARRWCSQKPEGEFFMQRLRTPSAGYDSPLPWLSHSRASTARHLWHYFFHFWPLVQTLGRGPTAGFPWCSSTPPSLGRGRVAPSPPPKFSKDELVCCAVWIFLPALALSNDWLKFRDGLQSTPQLLSCFVLLLFVPFSCRKCPTTARGGPVNEKKVRF